MRRPSFIRGVVIALILALLSYGLGAPLAAKVGSYLSIKILLSLLSAAYLAYLISASATGTGRIVVFLAYLLCVCASWIFVTDLVLYAIINTMSISVARALMFYPRLRSVLLDFGLSGVGFTTAYLACITTNSAALSVWCFFLVQSLFVAIPHTTIREPAVHHDHISARFTRALNCAKTAARRLERGHC